MIQFLSRSEQIFRKLLVFNASVLLAMTLQRIVLFLLVVRHWVFGADASTIMQAFFMGLRFDLCVLGFLNIPVLFIVWAISSNGWVYTKSPLLQSFRRWILWLYLALVTLAIHVVGAIDLFFFAQNGHRWTLSDWQVQGFESFAKTYARWGAVFSWGVLGVFIMLWVFRCLFILYRVQLHTNTPDEMSAAQRRWLWFAGLILPIVVVASAARGTWTAHHLGMEHSEVGTISSLNQLTLSPLWAFDKKF